MTSLAYFAADGIVLLGTWSAFAVLVLLSTVFFGVLVPRAKAPIFAQADADLPRKVLDEYVPTYTAAIASAFFARIGPTGRAAYRRFYFVIDFWFPGAIAALALASLVLIAYAPYPHWAWLALIAVPSWLFDMAENLCHFHMAGSYPRLSPIVLKFGPFATRLKWIFAVAPVPVALSGFAIRLIGIS